MLRAGSGGVEWAHPTETEKHGKDGSLTRPKKVRFEQGQEVDPALLPPGTDVEILIACGQLVQDTAGEVKAAVEAIAYHAEDGKVFHTREDCTVGNDIEPGNRLKGDGGKKLCKECAKAK